MANAQPTKLKIIDAAEALFAEHGFSETSLRQITKKAEVNLASVNYHFGSKKELIQAVVERYLKILVPNIARELTNLRRKNPTPELEEVFCMFIQPILSLDKERKNGTSILLQLLGRGYTDAQGHLRWFFETHYGKELGGFVALVHQAQPGLSASEIFWRLHFTLGAIVFTMASSDALIAISNADLNEKITIKGVIDRLIPYIAAGVRAPIDSSLHNS
jgi:AcrR family transcriptional regulator